MSIQRLLRTAVPINVKIPLAIGTATESVRVSNPVTGYKRTLTTGTDGAFQFNDVPPNNYQLSVTATLVHYLS